MFFKSFSKYLLTNVLLALDLYLYKMFPLHLRETLEQIFIISVFHKLKAENKLTSVKVTCGCVCFSLHK